MNQSRYRTKSRLSRQSFIRGTATALAGFALVPRHVLGGAGFVPPSEKVNIAIVGCGGQGRTKKLSWDAKAMKCSNAPEADKFLAPPREESFHRRAKAIAMAKGQSCPLKIW